MEPSGIAPLRASFTNKNEEPINPFTGKPPQPPFGMNSALTMIEKMITEIKDYLPLLISDITWDGTVFNMYGENWSFTTLSAWRVTENGKMAFGCYDKSSADLIIQLKELKILSITTQESLLKIDPVFLLSNKQKLEVFSTDIPKVFQKLGI